MRRRESSVSDQDSFRGRSAGGTAPMPGQGASPGRRFNRSVFTGCASWRGLVQAVQKLQKLKLASLQLPAGAVPRAGVNAGVVRPAERFRISVLATKQPLAQRAGSVTDLPD